MKRSLGLVVGVEQIGLGEARVSAENDKGPHPRRIRASDGHKDDQAGVKPIACRI